VFAANYHDLVAAVLVQIADQGLSSSESLSHYVDSLQGVRSPGVLSLEILQSFGLVDPHATVFLALAVKDFLSHAELLHCLGDGLALSLRDFGFAQFAEDRFGGVSFSGHDPVLLSGENTTLKPRPVSSG
jgi:hypothetical protein